MLRWLAALLLLPALLPAQPPNVGARDEYFAGSELEDYLRTLQILGDSPLHPWSVRKFSPREVDGLMPPDTLHPWAGRYDFSRHQPQTYLRLVRPTAGVRYNSTFPYGFNDGAVWAGRGVTGDVSAGFAARWGALSLVVAPMAFVAENAGYDIVDNGRTGPDRFGDAQYPTVVDYPQRFGTGAVGRVDLGESTLRLDWAGIAVGASTAHEWWGPAQTFPFLLGNNAAGFPHVFVGTSQPANLWIARLHARVLWGELDQSGNFVPEGTTRPRRFATGLAFVLQPRGFERLEFGGARFIHAPWPDEGLPGRYIWRAFEGILKSNLPEVDDHIPTDSRSRDGENQLGSVFARLVIPEGGFEVYGEFGREDHPWDMRYVLLSFDEQSSLTLGVRKAWKRRDGRIVRLRGERIDFRQAQVDQVRGGRVIYLHSAGTNQGHTQRGQLLGAGVGVASAGGGVIGVDLLSSSGRWSLEWTRIDRQERVLDPTTGMPVPLSLDVMHSVALERLLFRGPLDVLAGAAAGYNFNRNFDGDRSNLSVYLRAAARP